MWTDGTGHVGKDRTDYWVTWTNNEPLEADKEESMAHPDRNTTYPPSMIPAYKPAMRRFQKFRWRGSRI